MRKGKATEGLVQQNIRERRVRNKKILILYNFKII